MASSLRPFTRNPQPLDYQCTAPGCTEEREDQDHVPNCPLHGIPMDEGKKPQAKRR